MNRSTSTSIDTKVFFSVKVILPYKQTHFNYLTESQTPNMSSWKNIFSNHAIMRNRRRFISL